MGEPSASSTRPRATRSEDKRLLTRKTWPTISDTSGELRIVDLFAGAGGMSLGAFLAAREAGRGFGVALAVELDRGIAGIYRQNFESFTLPPLQSKGKADRVRADNIEDLFDGELGEAPTRGEKSLRRFCGKIHLLVGGPPCQGNSDLNNHTRRDDERNLLYERMARAAEILRPDAALIENVPTVIHDRHGVVDKTQEALSRMGYTVARTVLWLDRLGAPQRRRRHVMICLRGVDQERVDDLSRALAEGDPRLSGRDVEWAIGDLEGRSAQPGSGGFDAPSKPSPDNSSRLEYFGKNEGVLRLPDEERPACHQNGGHSYKSIYGRMAWGEPAQTITTGFGSMGQGCFVHPGELRTITPHEAARLQTFPDFFDFSSSNKRTEWARAIGNAVPPIAMREVVRQVLESLRTSRGDVLSEPVLTRR